MVPWTCSRLSNPAPGTFTFRCVSGSWVTCLATERFDTSPSYLLIRDLIACCDRQICQPNTNLKATEICDSSGETSDALEISTTFETSARCRWA